MLALQRRSSDRVRSYVAVNPNDTAHALAEIERCAARGHRHQARRQPARRRSAPRSDRGTPPSIACPCCTTPGSTAGATGPARSRRTPSTSRAGRATPGGGDHPRAHRRGRGLEPHACRAARTCLTSTSTCRAAAWIAGCSTRRWRVGAGANAVGRGPHDGTGLAKLWALDVIG